MFSVGIVGAGYMARHYLDVFLSRKEWSVAGIVSRSASRAIELSRRTGNFPVFESITELYSKTSPVLLVVAVPELQTRVVLEEIWRLPVVSLVEKPAGHNLSEAQKLRTMAELAEKKTFLALNRRFYESVAAAGVELGSRVGPRYIKAIDQHDTVAAIRAGQPPEVVENWHHANAIHTVDLIRYFSGSSVEWVSSNCWRGDGQFVIEANIGFESGDTASYSSYWNTPQTWSLSVNSHDRRVLLNPLESAYVQLPGNRNLQEISRPGLDLAFKPGISGLVDHLTFLFEGKPHSLVPLEEGVRSMELIEEIFGRHVALN